MPPTRRSSPVVSSLWPPGLSEVLPQDSGCQELAAGNTALVLILPPRNLRRGSSSPPISKISLASVWVVTPLTTTAMCLGSGSRRTAESKVLTRSFLFSPKSADASAKSSMEQSSSELEDEDRLEEPRIEVAALKTCPTAPHKYHQASRSSLPFSWISSCPSSSFCPPCLSSPSHLLGCVAKLTINGCAFQRCYKG